MIRFAEELCIALCQKGLLYRVLRGLWIPALIMTAAGCMMFALWDRQGMMAWLKVLLFLVGVWLVRVVYLSVKCAALVRQLQTMGGDLDVQLGMAKAWGGSVYLLEDYVFAPQYFLLVPYAKLEKFSVKSWHGIGNVTTDVQLVFHCGHRRYKTMLQKPEAFDEKQFQTALQQKAVSARNRSAS